MIYTPKTTATFVKQLNADGYIENAEDFPVVAEVADGFIAVVRNDNDGTWLVTKYYNDSKCWAAAPRHEVDSLSSAVSLFGYEVAAELTDACYQ
jgi:hypothetical protein